MESSGNRTQSSKDIYDRNKIVTYGSTGGEEITGAHRHATPEDLQMGRVPMSMVVPPRPYATLPPAPYAPPAQIYYPIHDTRVRRRRSPREARHERRRREARERESLTRSLERIHRKRRADRERPSDADLKRTYTGLDRAYAEQFIAVCDSSRHAAEQHDSLASTATSDSTNTQHSH